MSDQRGGRHNGPHDSAGGTGVKKDTINVTVRYAAAPKPFHDNDADRTETLSSLRSRVLEMFGLIDGEATPEGNLITYKLYHEKAELTDLSRTLADVAGQAGALPLKLSQFIQQGGQGQRYSALGE